MANSPLNGGSLLNGGQQGGTISIANGGTGATTAAGAVANLGLPPTVQDALPYVSGRFYMVGAPGSAVNATNVTPLASDTLYGVIGYVNNACIVNTMGFRTSSSNASVGASVKFGIYNISAALVPTTRLGLTTTGTTITDLATNASFTGTLDAAVSLSPGVYLFTVLLTAVTTGARTTLYSGNLWITSTGGTSMGNSFGSAPLGFTGTAVYATGMPSSFPAATPITSIANHPVIAIGIQ